MTSELQHSSPPDRVPARHRMIAAFRAQRLGFRRWWRGKPAFDFFYRRTLQKRYMDEVRKFSSHAEHVTERRFAHDLIKRFRPKEISEKLQRIGGVSDGGYLLPQGAAEVDAVFSPGVGFEAGFEAWFASQNVPCFLADASVDRAPLDSENFHFIKKFVGAAEGDDTVEINAWLESNVTTSSSKLGLQMDIEGAEYEVLPAITKDNFTRFCFIITEFHSLHRVVDQAFANKLAEILDLVDKTHVIVHTHANNSTPPITWDGLRLFPTLEIVAVRKDLVTETGRYSEIPHPLDEKNLPFRKDWSFFA